MRTASTVFLSLSTVFALTGCATIPQSGATRVPSASQTKSSPNSAQTVGQGGRPASSAGPIELAISSTKRTSSKEVFTFNQVIRGARVVTGSPSLMVATTNHSVTFARLKTSDQRVSLMVTLTNGSQKTITVVVPKMTTTREISLNNSNSSSAAKTTTVVSPPITGKPAPVVYFGPSAGRRIYITVDDGWFPSQRVLHLMQKQHVPITAFLIQRAAAEHMAYWKQFVKAGGVIEDHTVSHPWLTKVSFQQDVSQWAGPVQTYPKWFGQTPTLARPPYGAVNTAVQIAARKAGIQEIVMWSAEFSPTDPAKGLQTWNHKPLSPGEIVILHWNPGLYNEIQDVLAICKARNLVPAPLVLPAASARTAPVQGSVNNSPSSSAPSSQPSTNRSTKSSTKSSGSTQSATTAPTTSETSKPTAGIHVVATVSVSSSGQTANQGGTIQFSGGVSGASSFSGRSVTVTLYAGTKDLSQYVLYHQAYPLQTNGHFFGSFPIPNKTFAGTAPGKFILTFQPNYPQSAVQTVPITVPVNH